MKTEDIIIGLKRTLPELNVLSDVELSEHTTFKLGGLADIFIEPKLTIELSTSIKLLKAEGIRTLIIGRGSNLLFSENGFRGAIIKLSDNFSGLESSGNTISCKSGTSLAELSNYAMKLSLSGLEFASGIPGSVGGAVTMNAGAYGGEIKDVLKSALLLDEKYNVIRLNLTDMNMSYRKSIIQEKNYILLEATFELQKGSEDEIRAKMDDYNSRRKEKQPLNYASCGSTFKRPKTGYAAAMIEEANLKGLRFGGARVSDKHSGFIINEHNASFDDVINLIEIVKKTVFDRTGLMLEPEMKIIGEYGEIKI